MNNTTFWQKAWVWAPLAAFGCASLFALSALFPAFFVLGWVAFVPFLLGLRRCQSAWQAYGFGLLTGFLLHSLSTYWMAEFIRLFKAYSIVHSVSLASMYWFYCAQMLAIIAVLTYYCRRGNATLWVFPTALTLVFAFYPTLFPWQVGNAQSEFLVALQASDITGVSGLDFLIGLVNVMVAQVIVGRPVFFQRGAMLAYGMVAAWFVYGALRLSYWDNAIPQWESVKVGMIQPNEPPTIGTPDPRPGYSLSYPLEMAMTEELQAAGAEVIIWPELRNKQYHTEDFVKAAYQRQIAELSVPLIFQSFDQEKGESRTYNFNAATYISEHGQEDGKYRKIRRIPMAEYLPFFENSDTVKRWVRAYMGEFFGNYSAGPTPEKFDLNMASFKPFICYEVMFPNFVAASMAATGGDIITVQSNNGWFGETRIPYQHMDASVLRSVENRRPMVHVVNNGLGVVSLPNGRTILHTAHREIAGYLVDVPYNKDTPITLYSRFPYWLIILLGSGMLVMLWRSWRERRAAVR